MPTLQERFDAKTKPGPTVRPELGPCLDWTGATSEGYGRIRVDGSTLAAHRLAWEQDTGKPIPPKMWIDHRCHRHICVRLSHLRLATPRENQENRTGPTTANKAGARGVRQRGDTGKWQAYANDREGRQRSGGCWPTKAEAAQAARELRNQLMTHNDTDRTQE